jgi:hypothetical protein
VSVEDHAQAVGLVDVDDACQWSDRAGHQAVASRDLARLPRQLDRGRVDRLDQFAGVVAREPRARGGEARGLDQLGAGLEVGEVDREHLRRVLVRREVEQRPRRQAAEQLGTHRAVAHHDALRKTLSNRLCHAVQTIPQPTAEFPGVRHLGS